MIPIDFIEKIKKKRKGNEVPFLYPTNTEGELIQVVFLHTDAGMAGC